MIHRVASLGMYDTPGVRAANDDLWTAIAGRLRTDGINHVPDELDRSRPLADIWSDPALLLAQTCGYPLLTQFQRRLRYVTTPRYRVAGGDATAHRSRLIVRSDDDRTSLSDYRGRAVAVNDEASNTGMNLLRAAIAPHAVAGMFFGSIIDTGSHAASAQHVAAGRADIAAIDAVSFALLEREVPDLKRQLRTLGWTAATPGLPFVTSIRSSDRLVRRLRVAIAGAVADAIAPTDALLLEGISTIGIRRYAVLMSLERRAVAAGYPRLN